MNHLETLREWCAEFHHPEDDCDFGFLCQYAGRLAAFGDLTELDFVFQLNDKPGQFQGRLSEILVNRCKEGLWDLDEQLGEDLAHCVIEAQDFWCFRKYAGNRLSQEVRDKIEEWAERASKTNNYELDDEAVEMLEGFLISFPIPEDDQLAPIAAPLSDTQLRMLDRVLLSARRRPSREELLTKLKAILPASCFDPGK